MSDDAFARGWSLLVDLVARLRAEHPEPGARPRLLRGWLDRVLALMPKDLVGPWLDGRRDPAVPPTADEAAALARSCPFSPALEYVLLLGYRLLGYLEAEDGAVDPELFFGYSFAPSKRNLTGIGVERLTHVRLACERVLADGVPGDLIEAGVWRGGVPILMRALLAARGDTERSVWVADSFEGLPAPDPARFPKEERSLPPGSFACSLAEVRAGFERFGLLDDRVRFLPGWFGQTLPDAPIGRLAVLRIDADLYASTLDALTALYPRLSPGGFAIVDDFGHFRSCREAVLDFRAARGVREPLEPVDHTAVAWRRA